MEEIRKISSDLEREIDLEEAYRRGYGAGYLRATCDGSYGMFFREITPQFVNYAMRGFHKLELSCWVDAELRGIKPEFIHEEPPCLLKILRGDKKALRNLKE